MWWQRWLFVVIAGMLSFLIPLSVGLRDVIGVLLLALLLSVPLLVVSYIIVFKCIPPKYEIDEKLTRLFR